MAIPAVESSFVQLTFPEHTIYYTNLCNTLYYVIVTASATVTENWVREVRIENEASLASDTEVVVVGINVMHETTLLLCVGARCLMFRLSHAETVPQALRELLLEPACCFFTFGNDDHRGVLSASRHEVELGDLIHDIRTILYPEFAASSLRDLARFFIGFHIINDIGVQVVTHMDWTTQTLSLEQIMHASVEARCAYIIGRYIVDYHNDPSTAAYRVHEIVGFQYQNNYNYIPDVLDDAV